MGDYEIRAVAKLRLDSVKDKALIDEIEDLVAHRKLGDYITGLLRFAAEHRDDLEDLGFNGELRSKQDSYKKIVTTLNDEMIELKTKVDAIYDMAFNLKTAFEVGRVTALETQVDNILAADIVIQNQSNKLRRMFGEEIPLAFKGMAGEMRKADIDKAAKAAADIAVEHYGEVLADLANQMNRLQQMPVQPIFTMGAQMTAPIQPLSQENPVEDWEHNLKIAHADIRTDNEKQSQSDETPDETGDGAVVETLTDAKEVQFTPDLDDLASFFGM